MHQPRHARLVHVATFVTFVAVLVFPWVAGLLGASADTVERRNPTPRPDLDRAAFADVDTFATLNDYVRDRTPLRGTLTANWNRAWLRVGASGDPTVVEGPGDTMFLAEDFTGPCERGYELDTLDEQFRRYAAAADTGAKTFLFLVAPDKAAVLDHRLDGRADTLADCARIARPEFRQTLDATGTSFDLAPRLIAADQDNPGHWYYEHDSHWSFAGGDLVAEQIVEHFAPGLFDPSAIGTIDRSLPIRGDIYGRLGILELRDEPDPVRASLRPDVETTRSEEQTGGTRTIRTYTNAGGPVIDGRTLIVHDSMMNFVERQLAAYFEEAVFTHWDDRNRVDLLARIADADHVIIMRVERSIHPTIASALLTGPFASGLEGALATQNDRALSRG